MSAETPLSDKAASLAEEALDTAGENLRGFEKHARHSVDDAKDQAERLKAQADARVSNSVSAIETYVRTNPLQAAGIAFFAGVLAASFFRK